MPDPNDPSSYDPSGDDWEVNPGMDEYGNPVSRDPNAPSSPTNPYDDALSSRTPDLDADAKPISTPDNPVYDDVRSDAPASPEPMKDGLEEDEPTEDEPPEEEKPPVQRLPNRKTVRLPGAKGPLEVDSIGDYLEDVDWQEIDRGARVVASQNYPTNQSEDTDSTSTGDNPNADGKEKETDEPESNEGSPDSSFMTAGERRAKADNASLPDNSMSGMANVPDTKPPKTFTYPPTDPYVPHGGEGSPEHIQNQKSVDLDYGVQGSTSFNIPGQASTAKEDAVEKATDAINTATGRVVDMLQSLAQVMNNHAQRIAQIEDTLDMESERDV